MPKLWEFDELKPTDEIKDNLPDNYRFKIYRVTSGDSGKKYHVQLLQDRNTKAIFAHCGCNKYEFDWPLATAGSEKHFCKHIVATLEIANLR